MRKRSLETSARVLVLGVGGGGSNTVNRMIAAGVEGVEFVAANTDLQALTRSEAPHRIVLGRQVTQGLGAGGNPIIGARAAQESIDEVGALCRGADMIFIAGGMGGGTGSGACPVIAQVARECGALTVGVVTKPFAFEGSRRRRTGDEAIVALRQHLHTLIVVPNDRVLQVIDQRTSVEMAFVAIDDVLRQGIQSISEVITRPGLVNVDFADVRAVMSESGIALMSIGRGTGKDRAAEAARAAMASPLLDLSTEGARGLLFNVTGGPDLTLTEINLAAEVIRKAADPDANIIFGAVIDESVGSEVRITVIATGFDPAAVAIGDRQPAYRVSRDDDLDIGLEVSDPISEGEPAEPENVDVRHVLRHLRRRPRGLDTPPSAPDWMRRTDPTR
ncbi:MAG: cell division protein FtsZ [Chloroflexi bacterium]|nr:cell division protein FtsZ [Chloroflexota bacterium]